jgi:hypothetical protein
MKGPAAKAREFEELVGIYMAVSHGGRGGGGQGRSFQQQPGRCPRPRAPAHPPPLAPLPPPPQRGLSEHLARAVAHELTEKDVIRAHARDEVRGLWTQAPPGRFGWCHVAGERPRSNPHPPLVTRNLPPPHHTPPHPTPHPHPTPPQLGIDIDDLAKPMQASVASAIAFALGAAIPLLTGAARAEARRAGQAGSVGRCPMRLAPPGPAGLTPASSAILAPSPFDSPGTTCTAPPPPRARRVHRRRVHAAARRRRRGHLRPRALWRQRGIPRRRAAAQGLAAGAHWRVAGDGDDLRHR